MTECNKREINICLKALVMKHQQEFFVGCIRQASCTNTTQTIWKEPRKDLWIESRIFENRLRFCRMTNSKHLTTTFKILHHKTLICIGGFKFSVQLFPKQPMDHKGTITCFSTIFKVIVKYTSAFWDFI